MKTLEVTLPTARYPIHIGAGALDAALPGLVQRAGRDLAVVVTNDTLAALYPGRVEQALADSGLRVETLTVPDGEQYKTLETLAGLYDRLMALEASRKTVIVAFGGGVVGDMAGFAAATFMRGVPLLQVPTTLLAQVDSSVGGKTAVNHPLGKNTIGAFKQPDGVVIDLDFLRTLPERERRAGLFELIKHGIIRDPALFEYLVAHRDRFSGEDRDFWSEAVYRSCAVKAAVVEADEREADLRAILNFGHSLGHLIETHTGYSRYLHGEAVGIGMLFAAYASREWGLLPAADHDRIHELLAPLATPVQLAPLSEARFGELLMHDKKAAGGSLRFVILQRLGEAGLRDGTRADELWPLFQQFVAASPALLTVAPEAAAD